MAIKAEKIDALEKENISKDESMAQIESEVTRLQSELTKVEAELAEKVNKEAFIEQPVPVKEVKQAAAPKKSSAEDKNQSDEITELRASLEKKSKRLDELENTELVNQQKEILELKKQLKTKDELLSTLPRDQKIEQMQSQISELKDINEIKDNTIQPLLR